MSSEGSNSAGKEEGGFIQQYNDLIESKRETGDEKSDKRASIATSNLVSGVPFVMRLKNQDRRSGLEWICKQNRLRPELMRFVRCYCEHAQSDGESVNRGLPVLELVRG